MLPIIGQTVTRLGDPLINKLSNEIFGEGGDARATAVIIYNHTSKTLFPLSQTFDTGGISPNFMPREVGPHSIGGYRVESHGVATGVTVADFRYGFSRGDRTYCLRIVTSNPYAGDDTAEVEAYGGLHAKRILGIGNINKVEVDVWD